jgi:hypothetical protein
VRSIFQNPRLVLSNNTEGFKRSTTANSGITEFAAVSNESGEIKADYRRNVIVDTVTGEELGELKADYRRTVVSDVENGGDIGELKADY